MIPAVRTRRIHAGAWWLWAMALGTTATRTTNPALLLLIAAVAGYVTLACRTAAPWARSYGTFLRLAFVVILIRVAFHALLGGVTGPTVLFSLPEMPLPDWAAGIRLGGPVSAEGLLYATYDGLRLGVLLICVGAANSLADPRRLLQSLPGALYEVSVAVVVALTTAPQLVVSAQRIRRARQLRGHTVSGIRRFTSLIVPVIEDAVDRSLAMASTMDSRGYGRVGTQSAWLRMVTGVCVIGGLSGLALGAYGALDTTAPDALGLPAMLAGGVLGVIGLILGSRRVTRSHYRPDGWGSVETVIASSGIASLIGILLAERSNAAGLIPDFSPIAWPAVPSTAMVGIVLGLAPLLVARIPAPATSVRTSREVLA